MTEELLKRLDDEQKALTPDAREALEGLKKRPLRKVTEDDVKALPSDAQEVYRDWAYLQLTDNSIALEALDESIKRRQNGLDRVWKTGIKQLDRALDGGFLGGDLIFLGAVSSLGKTSLALQIGTQIAEHIGGEGEDVLIFSLEMSKNALNAKAISRYTYEAFKAEKIAEREQDVCCTARDIILGNVDCSEYEDNDGELRYRKEPTKERLYKQARERAGRVAKHLFFFVGENDISVDRVRETVQRHVKVTGKKPFVILDYLQILQPSDSTQFSDKRLLTDYDVSTLKTIARDNDVPVLAISAFNRNSYLEEVSPSSFRESSGIEYSSDVLLGMQYVGMEYRKHPMKMFNKDGTPKINKKTGKQVVKTVYESKQDHETRVRELIEKMDEWGAEGKPIPLELKVIKNRLSPKKGVGLNFKPAFNYFEPSDLKKNESTLSDILRWDVEIDIDDNPFDGKNAAAGITVAPLRVKK